LALVQLAALLQPLVDIAFIHLLQLVTQHLLLMAVDQLSI
jgi:hypothetical protein